jgi:5-methyltetrahydropteroyltriglutamate--homocysteine methyltransferase
MALAHILGFPRIGLHRELKFAVEAFWRGEVDQTWLASVGHELRQRHWALQRAAGIDLLTVGDFSFYDSVLDMAADLGSLPARFGANDGERSFAKYFACARGTPAQPAMEMTKWFDTNYHYLVPELAADQTFIADPKRLLTQIAEAKAMGGDVKPVLIGPLTFLYLSRSTAAASNRLDLLNALIPAYQTLLAALKESGVEWLQIDEPILALDLDPPWLRAFHKAYKQLANTPHPKLLLTTYFESVESAIDDIVKLPVDGIHLDLVRAPQQLSAWREKLPAHWILSAGVIDGRNIWRNDLAATFDLLAPLHSQVGDRLWVAPSCSLLHVPVSLETEVSHKAETQFDPEVLPWLAFANEKLIELQTLVTALNSGREKVQVSIDGASQALAARRQSRRVNNPLVQRRMHHISDALTNRANPFDVRAALQRERFKLPSLPTTTIGSFPQTATIRAARAAYKRRELTALEYLEKMRAEIRLAVAKQEEIGLDVLVHGEAERNDMVEYFGEQLLGYAFSKNGWVQSYGSRCVKPPIIYGDVHRPEPMTVETTRYAQSLTQKPMKGMLTGPVTMLQWSFVRDDQPRETTALQLAWCIRDEVADLEKAGIGIIQIDEPALREGLPLKKRDWPAYLAWSVRAFKLASAVADDATQIHTHMCYCEFNDILPSIAALDADVITIETSRSHMALLDGFGDFQYPNDIGPGIYDIHSPRVPSVEEMTTMLACACKVVPLKQLWVNPDCGLKTRGWSETESALRNMVEAARMMRAYHENAKAEDAKAA